MQQSNLQATDRPGFGLRLLDSLNASVICLDNRRRITYINATGEALFENSASSLLGRSFESLLSQVETSTISAQLRLDAIAMTEHEALITLANGKSFSADYSIYPDTEIAVDGGLLLEIRRHERQARFARDEFNRRQLQASQQLARGLAHEINNPLGGIRGAAQLLQRELERADWIEYTEVIISEVDRLQSLINNMLLPRGNLNRGATNIYEVLEHIRKIIRAAEPERIAIHRDYDPSIPEVIADRDLLIQAFLNIARNAVQAIEDRGDITFKTRIERNFSIGQVNHALVVRIDVSDNGRGISSELGDSIFLPMITDKVDGSGLGLPIAREIVSRHGGTILVQSEDNGTTFSIILPLESS